MLPKLVKVRIAFQATPARLSGSPSKKSHRGDLHPSLALTKGGHRFLCFGGFGGQVRHVGDAPTPSRWQRDVLLVDECRVVFAQKSLWQDLHPH